MVIMLLVNNFLFFLLTQIQFCPDLPFRYWNDYSEEERQSILSLPAVEKDAIDYYYGTMPVSDDDRTFTLLDELTEYVGDDRIKAFYLDVFNQILQKSDGALAEVMGLYCGQMVLSSPRFVLYYLVTDLKMYRLYTFHIGAELSLCLDLEHFTRDHKSYEWFCEQVKSSFLPGNAIPKYFLKAIEKKRIELSE